MARGAHPGLVSKADLSAYRAKWREPVMGDWRGYRIITAPPPSSGGIALSQLLAMKQDDAALFAGVGLDTRRNTCTWFPNSRSGCSPTGRNTSAIQMSWTSPSPP